MKVLTTIQVALPDKDAEFTKKFLQYLSFKGTVDDTMLALRTSQNDYFPKTTYVFKEITIPYVSFFFDDNTSIRVDITNTTGITRQSTYPYTSIPFDVFRERMKLYPLVGLDHTGFNLPYFDGIHPKILELREQLKHTCLYHTFPKHLEDAPWDFIIPGTKDEIYKTSAIDYSLVRKPKLEIVSADNTSIPLIQIDVQYKGKYEDFIKLFPEGIGVDDIKSLWVSIENNFGIDIFFVINEASEEDWSYQFAKERIG